VLMLAVLGSVELSIAIIFELVLGIGLGIGIPWATARLERVRFLVISSSYEPLYAFSVSQRWSLWGRSSPIHPLT
jgi:hypothetical protein